MDSFVYELQNWTEKDYAHSCVSVGGDRPWDSLCS